MLRAELLDHAELLDVLVNGFGRNRREAFVFFKKHLLEICGNELTKDRPKFNKQQIDYVAGLLTAFSMKSIESNNWPLPIPPSPELHILEKHFAIPNLPLPPWRYEQLGKLLLFTASFEDKFVQKYYLEYEVALIGEFLFLRAAVGPKSNLLLQISENFTTWLNYLRALKHKLIRGDHVFKPLIVIPKSPV